MHHPASKPVTNDSLKATLMINVRYPDMHRSDVYDSRSRTMQERSIIRVCAPAAHAGIGDALRHAFSTPPANPVEREFERLLESV